MYITNTLNFYYYSVKKKKKLIIIILKSLHYCNSGKPCLISQVTSHFLRQTKHSLIRGLGQFPISKKLKKKNPTITDGDCNCQCTVSLGINYIQTISGKINNQN